MEYSPLVRELFATLPRCGELSAGPGTTVAGEAMALERGAWIRLEARLDGGRFVDCAFRAWGCPHTLGAAAIAAERLVGWRPGMPAPVNAHALAALLAAPAEKLGRLLVVEDAMQALLQGASGLQSPVSAH